MRSFKNMITIFLSKEKVKKYICIIFLLILYMYVVNITMIPKEIVILKGEKINLKKMYGLEILETASTSNNNKNIINMQISLFGKIPLRNVNLNIIENAEVVPIGKVIGLKLYTNGVLIVGMSEIESIDNEMEKPFENADIKEGDTIIKINEIEIDDIESLKQAVNESEGNDILLTLVREGTAVTSNIKPIKTEENEYKLGLWVKDAATGVGTITFYEKETQQFAALGHGITDSDTDKLIEIDSGEIVTSKIISIKKGEEGKPGEIKGSIINQQSIGTVEKNTQFGIYGKLNNLTSLNINTNNSMKVALRDEIEQGEAKIICSIKDGVAKEYDIYIEKIYLQNNYDNKSMLIKVTDEELLEETGGIIRGLSGAPIVQNGKFVGAVTNVLVSEPQIGYAIFGDMMIKELGY